MLTLSIFALSVLAPAPAVTAMPTAVLAHSRTVACHPDPSKNRGCFRESKGEPAAHTRAQTADNQPMIPCHPDPSKNRGCLRPSHTPAAGGASDTDATLAEATIAQ